MSKRIEYIDVAKGIGILLVVMGHNDFGLVSPFFYKLIYAFHMPLFFFVSGMFFKADLPFLTLLRRRYETVLKPYIVIILLIYFMTISFTRINIDVATARVIKAIYANGHYIDWVQLWFLPHLFALNIFAFIYAKLTRPINTVWARWIILAILQAIGVTFIGIFWPFNLNIGGRSLTLFGLPFSIDLILVSGFFFILGAEIKKIVPEAFFASPITLLGSVAGLLTMVFYIDRTIDFNTRLFQSLPINTLEALLGITFILAISKQIEKIPILSSGFRYIGKSSLVILIFHVPIQETWGLKVFYIFNNQILSYWVAYFAGVIFPILINYFLIQPNPIVRTWFGQSGLAEKENVSRAQG
ncbi:MAG: acyltransferase family protein [Chloroflexi bacterium]|nr:acyltransferase family protein [Chloroflexota bacterium]